MHGSARGKYVKDPEPATLLKPDKYSRLTAALMTLNAWL